MFNGTNQVLSVPWYDVIQYSKTVMFFGKCFDQLRPWGPVLRFKTDPEYVHHVCRSSLWNTLAAHVHQPNSLPLTRIACAAYIRYVVLTQGLRLHNQGLSCQHSTPTQHGSSNASLTKYVACPSSTASPTLYPLLCANFTNIRFHQLPKCITKNIPGAVGFLVIVIKHEQGL